MHGKAVCKASLQDKLNFPVDSSIPLFGVVSRLAEQKGFAFLLPILQRFLSADIQLVILGSGEDWIARELQRLSGSHKDKCHFVNGFDNALAHWIEASCDFFLMPSLFEPCGLNQMYSLRYGCLPIVRAVGGLKDTVESYTTMGSEGTGFMFDQPDERDLIDCLQQALDVYKQPLIFERMQQNAMARSFSWDNTATSFGKLYSSLHLC